MYGAYQGGAAGGASAFSGLSDVAISSPTTGQVPVYNNGTGKWENNTVSATDSTKLPKDGSSSMSGPLVFSGTQSSAGSSTVNIWSDAAGFNFHAYNGRHCFSVNGTIYAKLGTDGFTFQATQSDPGGSASAIWQDSSANLNYNVASSKTHNFNRNGSRVGGFPLTPSDRPSSLCVAGNSSTSLISLTTSIVNIIAFNSDTIANASYHDPTGVAQADSRFVALYTGKYRIKLCIAIDTTAHLYLLPFKNGGSGYTVPLRNFGPYYITFPNPLIAEMVVALSAGDYIEWGANPDTNVGYYPSAYTSYPGRTFAEFEFLGV